MATPILSQDPAALVRELHATALALAQAKQRAQAMLTPDNLQQVQILLAHFKDVAEAYRRTGASDLSGFDTIILNTGNYIAQAVQALPSAIAAIPSAITGGLIRGLWPWLLGGALTYWYVTGRAGQGRSLW